MSIRVRRELLVPFHVTGLYFALALIGFAVGPLALATAGEWLVRGEFRSWQALAVVHIYTLGVGTAAIFGALPQLSPVLLQAAPPPAGPLFIAAVAYAIGLSLMISGFATAREGLILGGGLLILTAAVGIIAAVMRVWRRRTQGAVALPFFVSGVSYLALLMSLGLLLAVHWRFGVAAAAASRLYAAHVLVGSVGWFGFMILGTSYFLIPFFGVQPTKAPGRWGHLVAWALHAAIWIGLVEIFLKGSPRIALAVAAATAVLFLWDHRRVYLPVPGRENAIKWGVRWAHFYLALLALAAAAGAAGVPFDGPLSTAAGMCFLAGWVGNSVLGYQHRILPFLAWHTRYMGKKGGVPFFSRMVNHTVAMVAFGAYNAGLLGAIVTLALGHASSHGWLWLSGGGAVVLAANLAVAFFK